MGGFGEEEEAAFARLLVLLQQSLIGARPDRDLSRNVASACVGDAMNGVVSPGGVQPAAPGTAMLVDMGLYTSDWSKFTRELDQALWGDQKQIGKDHLIAGLSASTDSWKQPGPTSTDISNRVTLLKQKGVASIAVFGGNWDFLTVFESPLREFLRTDFV